MALLRHLRDGPTRTHSAKAEFGATVTLTAEGRVGISDDATIEQKVAHLLRAVDGLQDDIAKVRADSRERDAAVDERFADMQARHDALVHHVEEQTRHTERLNTQGFPLAILGAILAGVPFWFVSWWWTLMFVFTVVVVGLRLRESVPALRDGWRTPTPRLPSGT